MRQAMAALTICLLTAGAAPSALGAQEAGGGRHLELPGVLEGGDAGPTLLLLHCAGCGAASWERFMEVNGDRFRMVAPTLPGYAGSPRPDLPLWTGETPFQDHAIDLLAALLEERDLTDVTVVGHSFGSLVGLRLAAERPARIRAVVNVDGSPTNPPDRARQSPAERLAAARLGVDETWAVQLQEPARWRAFNRARSQPDEEQRSLHHGMFMASDRVSMVHYWRDNLLRDRNPDFVGLGVPYLDVEAIGPHIQNVDSAVAAHRTAVRAVAPPADFREVLFHQTSHWVHLQRPRALGDAVEDFLAGRRLRDVGPFRMGRVVEHGSGDRDVVLMPCLGCDDRSWDAFMERNAERYHMLAVTWPGMGDTSLPDLRPDPEGTPYFDYLVEALRRTLEAYGLERPVLAGHSAAAVQAVRFAAEHPDHLSGVVNIDAVVANRDTFGYTAEERRTWADREMAGVLARCDHDDAWRELNAPPTSMPDPALADLYGRMWRTPPRAHVFAYWRDWLRTDAGRLLPGLRVPFLAIHALPTGPERAAHARTEAVDRYRRAPLPPGARVAFVAGSGHTVWEYRPAAFDALLADFVLG